MKILILFLLITTSLLSQVGIGTPNPQAQLEVAGGNIRLSDYGSGTVTGTPLYSLAVDANGDVIETTLSNPGIPGLQYFTWNTANVSAPAINTIGTLGVTTTSGNTVANLDNTLRANIAPDNDGYILRFVGTILVENTGSFTFSARSDDGSRIYIDGVLVVENWFNQGPTTRTVIITLANGEHRIEFWYYENSGGVL